MATNKPCEARVTELETLRRRRELVVLSAEVQRATVVHRLDRIEASPMRAAFGFAANATRAVAMRRLAVALIGFASGLFRRRARQA